MQSNINRIHEFVLKRMGEVQAEMEKATDEMAILKLAVTQLSFAHILSQYLQDRSFLFGALMRLARAYIGTESYEEALIQARLAKKEAEGLERGLKEKAVLLIAECLVKQSRFQDVCEIFSHFDMTATDDQSRKNYYQTLLTALVELGWESKAEEAEERYRDFVLSTYGDQTSEYGLFLIKKGRGLGRFEKYGEALENLKRGIEILIEKKCKDKKQITSVYLLMADYHRRLGNLEKEYCSLVCAQSMARQLEDPDRAILPIVHGLAANLMDRREYEEALGELRKAKELERRISGESSVQMARTTKKIIEVLNMLNLKTEARKCEQEYSRIVGSTGPALKDKSNL